MVKSLADELTLILNWIENPGLGHNAVEEAKNGLICFCRGLVVGLRASEPIEVRGDAPIQVDEEDLRRAEAAYEMRRAEAKERRRKKEWENSQDCARPEMPNCPVGDRPVDEALKDPGAPIGQRGLL